MHIQFYMCMFDVTFHANIFLISPLHKIIKDLILFPLIQNGSATFVFRTYTLVSNATRNVPEPEAQTVRCAGQ